MPNDQLGYPQFSLPGVRTGPNMQGLLKQSGLGSPGPNPDMAGYSRPQFYPTQFFTGGIGGAFYDFSDPLTLFSDEARTTVQLAEGGFVRGVADLSNGNARHLAITTPNGTLKRSAGYIEWISATEGFGSPLGQLSSPQGFTWAIAVRQGNTTSRYAWIDSFANGQEVAELHCLSGGQIYGFTRIGGADQVVASGAGAVVAGSDYVCVLTCTPTQLTLRLNKTQIAQTLYAAGLPLNKASARIGICASWEGIAPAAKPVLYRMTVGRTYAALAINRPLIPQEIYDLETWMYLKAGLAMP